MAAKKTSSRKSSGSAKGAAKAAQDDLSTACRAADVRGVRSALCAGADPNLVRRGWGPVHALIQETVHGEGRDDERSRCDCLAALSDAGEPRTREAARDRPALAAVGRCAP